MEKMGPGYVCATMSLGLVASLSASIAVGILLGAGWGFLLFAALNAAAMALFLLAGTR